MSALERRSILRFLFKVFLFGVASWLLTLAGLWLPYPRSQAYGSLPEDCYGHGPWLYHRLFEDPRPIDVAFLGSSRTLRAVHEEQVFPAVDSPVVANLGYCRLGRNLHWVIASDLMDTKPPGCWSSRSGSVSPPTATRPFPISPAAPTCWTPAAGFTKTS